MKPGTYRTNGKGRRLSRKQKSKRLVRNRKAIKRRSRHNRQTRKRRGERKSMRGGTNSLADLVYNVYFNTTISAANMANAFQGNPLLSHPNATVGHFPK